MNAVDTNVFVYALDHTEPAKQTKARELVDRLVQPPIQTVLPWQVAAELLSCLRKWESANRITAADVEAHFRDVLSMFPLSIPTAKVFEIAFHLKAQFSLSHWDNLLLAACKEAGVATLFSEDLDPATDYDGLRVVNPFA
jgi:predicted nucleic acid-binding protein